MIEKIDVRITVLQGTNLVAKDRTLLGRKGSSDPFVEVWTTSTSLPPLGGDGTHHHRPTTTSITKTMKIGKTCVISKTLEPKWTVDNIFTTTIVRPSTNHPVEVSLKIYDHDAISTPDSMGVITVPVPMTTLAYIDTTKWYTIPPNSAPKATGQLQVRIESQAYNATLLIPGNVMPLTTMMSNSTSKQGAMFSTVASNSTASKKATPLSKVRVGLSWDVLNGNKDLDLDASLVAITKSGELSLPDTVYYGNKCNSNESVVHSGDEREGDSIGDDETILLFLDQIPDHVLAMYLVLTVATKGLVLGQVKSAAVRIYDESPNNRNTNPSSSHNTVLATFLPSQMSLSNNSTAMFLVRFARSSSDSHEGGSYWTISPIEETHPTGRNFGDLIPPLKALTRDLVPTIHIDPTERVGILRKGGNVRLANYSRTNRIPATIVLGLAWDVTAGVNIDLDASIICLDKHFNLLDLVYFRQLRSKDGSIQHRGDEREGDSIGDDEKITMHLHKVSSETKYIGFIINSFSGQELDDVRRASCHIYDPAHKSTDMCSYALSNATALNGYTALVLGCLYRDSKDGEWGLCIISEPARGRTAEDNVDELQNYLRRHPPSIPPPIADIPDEEEIVVSFAMPAYVPMPTEEEIDLSK